MTGDALTAWLRAAPRVLDGGLASALLQRGVAAAARLWGVGALMEASDQVERLHREYAAAGAGLLTAATFRVAPYSLRAHGLGTRASSLARLAVDLARSACRDTGALVFTSQTTLEDCYRPDLVPEAPILEREHAVTAAVLAEAHPDGLLLETFNTVREAVAAARAAARTGLPVVVSFACRGRGRLLSGEDAAAAAAAVTLPGVAAIGVNCTAVKDIPAALERLGEGSSLPRIAYANNAWSASDSSWLAKHPLDAEAFAAAADQWLQRGARMVGGCCGTAPDHVAAIARRLRRQKLE